MSSRTFGKYASRGADYHWQMIGRNPLRRHAGALARYDNILELMQRGCSVEGKKVLDVGCGDGVLSFKCHKLGALVHGVDLMPASIEAAKARTSLTNIEFQVGDVYELPFPDDSFDIVMSSEVIEHLEKVPQYLSEIRRVLKPQGRAIISTPIRNTKIPLDEEHVQEWFFEDYPAVFSSHFSQVETFASHPVAIVDLYTAKFFGRPWFKLLLNIFSLFRNPYPLEQKRFRYMLQQYALLGK